MATYFVSGQHVKSIPGFGNTPNPSHFEIIIEGPIIRSQSDYQTHIRDQVVDKLDLDTSKDLLWIKTCNVLFKT